MEDVPVPPTPPPLPEFRVVEPIQSLSDELAAIGDDDFSAGGLSTRELNAILQRGARRGEEAEAAARRTELAHRTRRR